MDGAQRPDHLTLAAFVGMILVAGGNAVGISIAVRELDPFWAAAVRFTPAGLIFAIAMPIFGVPLPRGRALAGALLYGLFTFFLGFGFAFWALQETPAGTGQVLLAVVPLLTLLLASVQGLERLRLRALLGSVIAFAGAAYVASDRISLDVPLVSLAAVFAGALCFAQSFVVVKQTPQVHPIATNAVGMLAAGIALAAVSAIVGEPWIVPTQPETWAALAFLILGGSVVVFWLVIFVVSRWTASASSYGFLLIPLATVPYSAILTGESITPALVVGGAIILGGVYLGAFAPERRPVPVA